MWRPIENQDQPKRPTPQSGWVPGACDSCFCSVAMLNYWSFKNSSRIGLWIRWGAAQRAQRRRFLAQECESELLVIALCCLKPCFWDFEACLWARSALHHVAVGNGIKVHTKVHQKIPGQSRWLKSIFPSISEYVYIYIIIYYTYTYLFTTISQYFNILSPNIHVASSFQWAEL